MRRFALVGIGAGAIAAGASIGDARAAAAQSWPAFVLVTGLLLVGLVAEGDGVFAAAGERLAHSSRRGVVLFFGSALLIGVTTALLNLDTSVAFLTPVLVYAARSRGESAEPLLLACILLSNAGSLFLPGSNLTNLIVLGHLHVTGGAFFAHMWLPALSAFAVTVGVIAACRRDVLRVTVAAVPARGSPPIGIGLAAIAAATTLTLVLGSPALPVFVVGAVATVTRLLQRKDRLRHVLDVVGVPLLIGLFGLAVAFGTVGRAWSGPATLLSHLDGGATAVVAALSSVLMNNLPAASLLAARRPEHPYALLIGLNLGPNLFVTGSLAWFLWLRTARAAGAEPSIASAARVGLLAVPVSIAAAIGGLLLIGSI